MTDKKRILLVDDSEGYLNAIEGRIYFDGGYHNRKYTVDKTTFGKEAIKLISKNKYDVIVSDIILPDLNAHETVNFFKLANKKSKFILFSEAGWYSPNPILNKIKFIPKIETYGPIESILKDLMTEIIKEVEHPTINKLNKLKITNVEFNKLARPDWHPMSPFEKAIHLERDGPKKTALLEFNVLHKMIKEIKSGKYSQKDMNAIMDRYHNVTEKLQKIKNGIKPKPIKVIRKPILRSRLK